MRSEPHRLGGEALADDSACSLRGALQGDPTPLPWAGGGGRRSRKRTGRPSERRLRLGDPPQRSASPTQRTGRDCCEERQADVASWRRTRSGRLLFRSATYLIGVCKVMPSSHPCFQKTCIPTTSIHVSGPAGPEMPLQRQPPPGSRPGGPRGPFGPGFSTPKPSADHVHVSGSHPVPEGDWTWVVHTQYSLQSVEELYT